MNELIEVNYDSGKPTVSGRNLHEALGIKTPYTQWFERMCAYGFVEGKDYILVSQKCETNNPKNPTTTVTDHEMTLDMAKEIGKRFREHFIAVEKAWNDPVLIMGRAYEAQKAITEKLNAQVLQLEGTVAVQVQQISELQPKASYYDVVLNSKDLLSTTKIAKDYGKSAIWLNTWLHEQGIQYKQGDIWLLYQKYAEQGYTNTKTQTFNGSDGEIHTKVHTYWTQKGRLFIYEQLKAVGILPLIEQNDEEETA